MVVKTSQKASFRQWEELVKKLRSLRMSEASGTKQPSTFSECTPESLKNLREHLYALFVKSTKKKNSIKLSKYVNKYPEKEHHISLLS